jgi:hypothetical protein
VQSIISASSGSSIRRKPKRPYPYSEDADEVPVVVERQPVEVQRELPSQDNPNVESGEPETPDDSPIFEG